MTVTAAIRTHLTEQYAERLDRIKKYSCDLWGGGDRFHPFFTLHGPQHSEQVERIVWELLSSRANGTGLPALSIDSEQLFYLLAAVWLHDVGMIVSPSAKERRAATDHGIGIEDWIRIHHHERSLKYINENYSAMGLESTEGAYVALVSQAHRGEDLRVNRDLDHSYPDTKFLAAILRLADELDITRARTPEQLLRIHWLEMDAKSQWHWLKHWCVLSARPTYVTEFQNGISVSYVIYDLTVRLPNRQVREAFAERVIDPIRRVLTREGVDVVLLRRGIVVDCDRFRFSVQLHSTKLPDSRSLELALNDMLSRPTGGCELEDAIVLLRKTNPGASRMIHRQAQKVLSLVRGLGGIGTQFEHLVGAYVSRVARASEFEDLDDANEEFVKEVYATVGTVEEQIDFPTALLGECRLLGDLGWRLGYYLIGNPGQRCAQLDHLSEWLGLRSTPLLEWAAQKDASPRVQRRAANLSGSVKKLARGRRGSSR